MSMRDVYLPPDKLFDHRTREELRAEIKARRLAGTACRDCAFRNSMSGREVFCVSLDKRIGYRYVLPPKAGECKAWKKRPED